MKKFLTLTCIMIIYACNIVSAQSIFEYKFGINVGLDNTIISNTRKEITGMGFSMGIGVIGKDIGFGWTGRFGPTLENTSPFVTESSPMFSWHTPRREKIFFSETLNKNTFDIYLRVYEKTNYIKIGIGKEEYFRADKVYTFYQSTVSNMSYYVFNRYETRISEKNLLISLGYQKVTDNFLNYGFDVFVSKREIGLGASLMLTI